MEDNTKKTPSKEETKNSADNSGAKGPNEAPSAVNKSTNEIPNEEKKGSSGQIAKEEPSKSSEEKKSFEEEAKKKEEHISNVRQPMTSSDSYKKQIQVVGFSVDDVQPRHRVMLYYNDDQDKWYSLPKDMRGDVKEPLGSYFLPPPSKDVARGLDHMQEEVYMPGIVGLRPNEQGYSQKVRTFWLDWEFNGKTEGVVLDITTVKIPSGRIDSDGNPVMINFPIEPEEYIIYNMAKNNPICAIEDDELLRKGSFPYYMIDIDKEKREEEQMLDLQTMADVEFVRLASNIENNRQEAIDVIQILKEPHEVFSIFTPSPDITRKLKQLSSAPLEKNEESGEYESSFLKVVKDPSRKEKALLNEGLQYGIFTLEGNTYFDEDEAMGTAREAIVKIKSPDYGPRLQKVMKKLEQKRKESIVR